MEKLFKLKENGTNVKTEILAGITTFLAMSYILAVNPGYLGNIPGATPAGVFMATRQIDMGERRLVKAISMIEELVAKIGDHKYAARLNELADRLRLTVCLCENSKNIMRFQDYLDRTDKSELPAHDTNPAWFEQGHPYFIPIKEIFRNEVDNTLEMISILEKYEKPLITVAPTKDMEDICYAITQK